MHEGGSGGVLSSASDDEVGGLHAPCASSSKKGVRVIEGFEIGHHTADSDGWLTGTTVVLARDGAVENWRDKSVMRTLLRWEDVPAL